jgi:hypothetical protein
MATYEVLAGLSGMVSPSASNSNGLVQPKGQMIPRTGKLFSKSY